MIFVTNKKRKEENIKKEFPNAIILDVTSKSQYSKARMLSPFYPHNNIPIPFSKGETATCVEAVWQGLKVFEKEGVNMETFKNSTMQNLKRTVRKFGLPKGHQKGLYSEEILDYYEARILIYLPTYKWVLDNIPEVHDTIMRIKSKSEETDIVLLDYNTNIDYRNISSPLSHAGLIKLYIEGDYPEPDMNTVPPPILSTKKQTNKDSSNKRKVKKKNETSIVSKKKKANKIIQQSLFPELD